MKNALRTLGLCALSMGAAASCDDPAPVREPAPKASKAPLIDLGPAPMCRFDPVSQPSGEVERASDLCFTPVALAPEPTPEAADAGEVSGPDGDELSPACPPDMVLVEGDYCPKVRHKCKRYLDTGFLAKHRCAEFEEQPECLAPRQFKRFCIDRDEYEGEQTGADAGPSDRLPLVDQSWVMGREVCQEQGKRLCFEAEWEFACEGEQMLPYPYGFKRDSKLCNFDKTDLEYRGKLRDLRQSAQALRECTSPFGVRNMVGNVDEWTQRDGQLHPWRASLRGGWWLAGRNNCRAATTGHDEYFHGAQTGFRCCSAAR